MAEQEIFSKIDAAKKLLMAVALKNHVSVEIDSLEIYSFAPIKYIENKEDNTAFPYFLAKESLDPAECFSEVLNSALQVVWGRNVYWRRPFDLVSEKDFMSNKTKWRAWVRFSVWPITDEERAILEKQQ